MATYTLTYFPMKARAEVIRMVFAQAGQDYEDKRITGDDWTAFKLKAPLKAVPVLTIKDKGMVCQSTAIARYLAKKFGLFGSDPFEELLIDEVSESVNDLLNEKVKWFLEKDETEKAKIEKNFAEVTVPKFLEYLRLRLKEGKGGFIVGSKLSLADICVFAFIDMQKEMKKTYFDSHSDIMKHYEMVKNLPKIAKWLKERPSTNN